MLSLKPCKTNFQSAIFSSPSELQRIKQTQRRIRLNNVVQRRKLIGIRGCSSGTAGEGEKKSQRRTFLTLEEAGLVEMSGLSTHERFLCRLTVSSLNLLRVIAEQEGCPIEELNAGRVCDWFVKDKLKREQNIDSSVLQWDDSEFQF